MRRSEVRLQAARNTSGEVETINMGKKWIQFYFFDKKSGIICQNDEEALLINLKKKTVFLNRRMNINVVF